METIEWIRTKGWGMVGCNQGAANDLDYGVTVEGYSVYAHAGKWWRQSNGHAEPYADTQDKTGLSVRVLGNFWQKLALGPVLLPGFGVEDAQLCTGCGFGCPLGDRMARELAQLRHAGVA